jgi:ATP-dependent exoDNAse (exonuclease V) beta subunit
VRYRPERFSATQLLTYDQCPTKYFLSYGLGIPEEPKLAYDTQPDELSERVRGALAGQVIHAMLERVNEFAFNGEIDFEKFDERYSELSVSIGISEHEERSKDYRGRAIEDIYNFIRSDFGKFVLSCRPFFTELPVQSQLDHQNSLYGIIDRLFQESDGSWHLLDYKTDARRRNAKQDQYAFQLGYYASLIKKLYPEAKQIKSTIYYTQLSVMDQKVYDLDSFNEVESSFLSIIEGIRTDEKIPELKLLERKLSHCEDCNYYNQKRKACVVPLD